MRNSPFVQTPAGTGGNVRTAWVAGEQQMVCQI